MENSNNKNNNNKKKRIYIILGILVFIFAITLIGVGIYFNKITSNNYIMGNAIDRTSALLRNYLDNNGHEIRENYTFNSKIKFNLNSEKDIQDSVVDLEALKRVNFLKNLNSMDTEITLKQDTKKEKLYFELDEKILNEEIVNYKFLVDDATKYYFLNNFKNTYINDGGCNYFEAISSENTSKDNIIYLYDFLINSLKSNLKDEYFERYEVEENINGKNESVKQISFRITDSIVREIAENVLSDLKNDERAKKILTSYDKKFPKWKIKDTTDFLKKNESYTINIYTTTFMCEFLKLEVIHIDGDDKDVMTYEGDEVKGEVYYIENDQVKYNVHCKFEDRKYEFKIYDDTSNSLGEFTLEFDKKRTNFLWKFDDGKKKIDMIYNSKYTKGNGSKKDTNDTNITFKFLENKVSKLSGDIQIVTEISDDVKINDDLSGAVLKATLSDLEKQNLETRRDLVRARLER